MQRRKWEDKSGSSHRLQSATASSYHCFANICCSNQKNKNAKPPAHKIQINFHIEIKECIQSGHLALFYSYFLLLFFLILFDKTLNGRKSFWGISIADGFAVNSHSQVYTVKKPTPQWPPLEGAEESNPSSIICWICTKDAKFFQQMFPVTAQRKRSRYEGQANSL